MIQQLSARNYLNPLKSMKAPVCVIEACSDYETCKRLSLQLHQRKLDGAVVAVEPDIQGFLAQCSYVIVHRQFAVYSFTLPKICMRSARGTVELATLTEVTLV